MACGDLRIRADVTLETNGVFVVVDIFIRSLRKRNRDDRVRKYLEIPFGEFHFHIHAHLDGDHMRIPNGERGCGRKRFRRALGSVFGGYTLTGVGSALGILPIAVYQT